MMDSLNRQRAQQNSRIPYTSNKKKYTLEERNTVVVKKKKIPFMKRIRKLFKGQ